jgi:hypothetical protein
MKKIPNFKPFSYKASNATTATLIIEGQKLPPPSKRITLNQKNIKVLSAKIIYKSKKGEIEYEVSRINHVRSFEEVRLHTNNVLYPGTYVITLEYQGNPDEAQLGEKVS